MSNKYLRLYFLKRMYQQNNQQDVICTYKYLLRSVEYTRTFLK